MSLQEVEFKMDQGYGACAETQPQVCNRDVNKSQHSLNAQYMLSMVLWTPHIYSSQQPRELDTFITLFYKEDDRGAGRSNSLSEIT